MSGYAPTLGTGRALRTYCCIKALAQLGPVDIAFAAPNGEVPSPEYLAIAGLRFIEICPSRGFRRAAMYAGKRLSGTPEFGARGVSPELVRVARELALEPGRGRVVLGDLHASSALLPIAGRRPLIYNAHNLESSYSHAQHGARPWNRYVIRTFERRLLRNAAESWMVSRRDIAEAQRFVPGARLRYVPNVVDVAAIAPVIDTAGTRRILLVGDFAYAPNRTGLRYLIDEVMPIVWLTVPDATVELVGRGLEPSDSTDRRIEVRGFVDDLAAAYRRADAVAVPLTEGGGTPTKFVEALAYGVPVVSTAFAALRLEVEAGRHYLEGADSLAFAARLVSVLQRGARDVALAGRRLVEQEYSIESLAQRIAA